MDSCIASGTNLPEKTNVFMGQIVNKKDESLDFDINVDLLSKTEKEIYEAFFDLIGPSNISTVINSPLGIVANRVTPNKVEIFDDSINFKTLPKKDKDTADQFFKLIYSIAEKQNSEKEQES